MRLVVAIVLGKQLLLFSDGWVVLVDRFFVVLSDVLPPHVHVSAHLQWNSFWFIFIQFDGWVHIRKLIVAMEGLDALARRVRQSLFVVLLLQGDFWQRGIPSIFHLELCVSTLLSVKSTCSGAHRKVSQRPRSRECRLQRSSSAGTWTLSGGLWISARGWSRSTQKDSRFPQMPV